MTMVTVGEGVAEEDSGRTDEAGCDGVGSGSCVVGTDCNDDVEQGTVETSGDEGTSGAVSYTHLTLPTKNSPCRSRWSPDH